MIGVELSWTKISLKMWSFVQLPQYVGSEPPWQSTRTLPDSSGTQRPYWNGGGGRSLDSKLLSTMPGRWQYCTAKPPVFFWNRQHVETNWMNQETETTKLNSRKVPNWQLCLWRQVTKGFKPVTVSSKNTLLLFRFLPYMEILLGYLLPSPLFSFAPLQTNCAGSKGDCKFRPLIWATVARIISRCSHFARSPPLTSLPRYWWPPADHRFSPLV